VDKGSGDEDEALGLPPGRELRNLQRGGNQRQRRLLQRLVEAHVARAVEHGLEWLVERPLSQTIFPTKVFLRRVTLHGYDQAVEQIPHLSERWVRTELP